MDTEQANRIAELEKRITEGAIENERARLDMEENCDSGDPYNCNECYVCQYYIWRSHKVERWMYMNAIELHELKGLPPPHRDHYLEM